MADEEERPVFRKIKKKPMKVRSQAASASTSTENANEDDEHVTNLEDIKEAQKIRIRKHGLNALECAVGKELAKEFDDLDENPWNSKGGGMLRLTDDKKTKLNAVEIEQDIKEQFKKETLLRDEHEEMKKYISQRLNKDEESKSAEPEMKKFKPQNLEDEILFRAAEQIKQFTSKQNDELLSNQMLHGIPEVDLGLNSRMNNIVNTEKKKMELLSKEKQLPTKNNINAISPDDPRMKRLRR